MVTLLEHQIAVTPDELANDEEYADIMEDMREECGKYGTVLQVRNRGEGMVQERLVLVRS